MEDDKLVERLVRRGRCSSEETSDLEERPVFPRGGRRSPEEAGGLPKRPVVSKRGQRGREKRLVNTHCAPTERPPPRLDSLGHQQWVPREGAAATKNSRSQAFNQLITSRVHQEPVMS